MTLLVHLIALRRVGRLRVVPVHRVATVLLHLLHAVGLGRVVALRLARLAGSVSDRRQLWAHAGRVGLRGARGGRVGGALRIGRVRLRRGPVSFLFRLALVVLLLLAGLPFLANLLEF